MDNQPPIPAPEPVNLEMPPKQAPNRLYTVVRILLYILAALWGIAIVLVLGFKVSNWIVPVTTLLVTIALLFVAAIQGWHAWKMDHASYLAWERSQSGQTTGSVEKVPSSRLNHWVDRIVTLVGFLLGLALAGYLVNLLLTW